MKLFLRLLHGREMPRLPAGRTAYSHPLSNQILKVEGSIQFNSIHLYISRVLNTTLADAILNTVSTMIHSRQITTVFSHAQTVVLCGNCNVCLLEPWEVLA